VDTFKELPVYLLARAALFNNFERRMEASLDPFPLSLGRFAWLAD
jgi:hypothetical protein